MPFINVNLIEGEHAPGDVVRHRGTAQRRLGHGGNTLTTADVKNLAAGQPTVSST
jgi:hypothetical protein